MRGLFVILVGLISVPVAAGAGVFGLGGGAGPMVGVSYAQARDEKVHQEVLEALEGAPWVEVIVALREPPAVRRAPLALPALQAQVAADQEDVLSGLTEADFEVLRRYEWIPAVFGRVSAAGLQKLTAHPNVAGVHANVQLHGALSESVPMINADDVHTVMGFTGAGVTVAVLDTGIDTDHADLQDDLVAEHCYLTAPDVCPCGGTTAHGSGCAEDGYGHGSHVSGIITSSGVVAPQGVAPDASIIAFKVLNDANSGWLSDWLEALNYIIGHPGDGVDVVNMSLATYARYTPPCDTVWLGVAAAINTLWSAGVPVFVATGNDADKSHLPAPACISTALSVGAVYDANVGSASWGVCTDATTAADKVVCFSNSHSQLDLLAPGSVIYSSYLSNGATNMSGTSMAAPHAAAVAALMLDAIPRATPGQIESCMKLTGVQVTDPGNGVTTPRVDALAALQCLLPGVGGIAELLEADSTALETSGSSGGNEGFLAGVAAATAGVVALGGAALCARRRWVK